MALRMSPEEQMYLLNLADPDWKDCKLRTRDLGCKIQKLAWLLLSSS